MKYTFTLTAVFISAICFGQVTRNVLLEHFTSNSSLPSATQNPLFYGAIIDPNIGDVIHVAYHKQGGDIFGDADPIGVNTRQNLYGSTNIPFSTMSGRIPDNSNTNGGNWLTYSGAPTGFTQTAINNELGNSSDISIRVDQTFNNNFSQLNIRCVIINETGSPVNMNNRSLYLSLVTETLSYSSAPNSNGETYFRNTHRGFVPDHNGTVLNGSLASGDSIVLTFQEPRTTDWIDLSEVKSIAFVQDNNSNEIIQAGESNTPTFNSFINLSLEDATSYSGDYCTSTINPTVRVKNSANGTLDSVQISVTVNGNLEAITWYELPIIGVGQENIQLASLAIDTGSNEIIYEITNSRGDIETDYSDNVLRVSQLLYIPPAYNNSTYTFESETVEELPTRGYYRTFNTPNDVSILYVADQSISSSVNSSIGGFGDSENALVFDFFNSAENERIEYFLEEHENGTLPEVSTTLKLDYAYAERDNAGDRFIILSSIDCGNNWDTIFDKSGSDLATTSNTTGRFWPTANDWDSLEFQLSTTPLIRMVGISDRRNALYIDNISVDIVGSSSSELNYSNDIAAYPNPFNNEITLSTSREVNFDSENLKYIIYDLSGREMQTGVFQSNQQYISVNHLPAGSYLIQIIDDEKQFLEVINMVKF